MTFRPRIALLWMLLLLAAGTSRAQEQGVLLGLSYTEPIPEPLPYYAGTADSLSQTAYRTFLLTEDAGTFTLVPADSDALLVPRGRGFWRVGTKRSLYNDWVEDFVWAAPEGRPPHYAGIQPFNGEYCEGHRTQTILHAGPRYLSLDQRSAGYCEGGAHPWFFQTLAVVPIDSTTHSGLPIDAVLGADAAAALAEATEAFLDDLPDEATRDAYLDGADPANWGLVRREGGWHAVGRLENAEAARTAYTDLPLPSVSPEAIAAGPLRRALWRQIREFAPTAVDAVVAPGEAWLVLMRPGRLSVHPLEAGRIGAPRLTQPLPPGARIVLTRWASGATLQRWARYAERFAAGS